MAGKGLGGEPPSAASGQYPYRLGKRWFLTPRPGQDCQHRKAVNFTGGSFERGPLCRGMKVETALGSRGPYFRDTDLREHHSHPTQPTVTERREISISNRRALQIPKCGISPCPFSLSFATGATLACTALTLPNHTQDSPF